MSARQPAVLDSFRHLHHSGQRYTLCGCARWVPFRSGSRVFNAPGHKSVHVTKARKTDCDTCRRLFRAEVDARRPTTPQEAR